MSSKLTTAYTDESYLSRRDLQKAMNTTFIDSFWKEQLDYRKEYRVDLPLYLINRTPLYLTLTPAIKDKIALVKKEIDANLRLIGNLSEQELMEVKKNTYFPILKSISFYEGVQITDMSLRALLNRTYRENEPNHMPVIHYLHTLNHYMDEKNHLESTDEFLGDAFVYLLGTNEITKFYRQAGPSEYRPTSVINGYDYERAPARDIEAMMERLYKVTSGEKNPFIEMMIALFYVSYIEPFDSLNHSLAALLAKNVYAGEMGNAAFTLPLEPLLLERSVMEAIKETKKEGDLTYYLLAALSSLRHYVSTQKEAIDNARIQVYKPEFINPAKEEAKIPEPIVAPIQPSLFDEVIEEPQPEPVVEEEPKEPEIIIKAEPKNALKPSRTITVEEMNQSVPLAQKTFGVPQNVLSDKEVKEYVRYLLETNPNLNKKQASFLANHSTPGRFYTIQQYKAFCKCAYETARTSMDHLTNEGYYEKLQVKNKFVYRLATKGE